MYILKLSVSQGESSSLFVSQGESSSLFVNELHQSTSDSCKKST